MGKRKRKQAGKLFQEIFERFLKSKKNTPDQLNYYGIDISLRAFLTDKEEEGGLQSVFEEDEYLRLINLVRESKDKLNW